MRIVLALMLLTACRSAPSGEPKPWRWHEVSTELYDATFSPSGDEIAFVRQRHFEFVVKNGACVAWTGRTLVRIG